MILIIDTKVKMKLTKSCNVDKFAPYFVRNQQTTHNIKLVVDDIIIDVSRIVLSVWSEEFENKADVDHEIFLTDFIGKYFIKFIYILIILGIL